MVVSCRWWIHIVVDSACSDMVYVVYPSTASGLYVAYRVRGTPSVVIVQHVSDRAATFGLFICFKRSEQTRLAQHTFTEWMSLLIELPMVL